MQCVCGTSWWSCDKRHAFLCSETDTILPYLQDRFPCNGFSYNDNGPGCAWSGKWDFKKWTADAVLVNLGRASIHHVKQMYFSRSQH